jgi:tetratricopeptide (TPR) repeat protein
VILADVAARNRLYREATAFAAQGSRATRGPRALALLGVNQLRLGAIAEGRKSLVRSFALDQHDPWSKRQLDLLDTFDDYVELRTPRFVIVAERKDAPLLSLYVGPLAEAAFDSLAARYGYRPTEPVRVELFRSNADFSVRTVGLVGLGALGVSFGPVVAMDSPAARTIGEFNWGSTLWHELAHTFTLGATQPSALALRGLSVLEERRARPSWGADVSPEFLAAYAGGMLVPPSRMNDGFMRPRFPQEVILSYYQGSLIAEWIEQLRGMDGIRAMLAGYRGGAGTTQVVRDVLGMDLAQLDTRFDAYVRSRFARELGAVTIDTAGARTQGIRWNGTFADAMREATRMAEGQQWDAAVRELEKAKALLPSYAGEDSPYRTLARIHLVRGDTTAALRELQAMTARSEVAYAANIQLEALAAMRGETSLALAALERALYISPFDLAVHQRLAAYASSRGQRSWRCGRQAVLTLDPSDRVEAMYQLALACHGR